MSEGSDYPEATCPISDFKHGGVVGRLAMPGCVPAMESTWMHKTGDSSLEYLQHRHYPLGSRKGLWELEKVDLRR